MPSSNRSSKSRKISIISSKIRCSHIKIFRVAVLKMCPAHFACRITRGTITVFHWSIVCTTMLATYWIWNFGPPTIWPISQWPTKQMWTRRSSGVPSGTIFSASTVSISWPNLIELNLIWNSFSFHIKGIRHDDYDYGEVNQLLERSLKMFIKTACCFPERITKKDYDSILTELKHSEKVIWTLCTELRPSIFSGGRTNLICFFFNSQVHVNLMILEARNQAELLYALREIMRYMTWLMLIVIYKILPFSPYLYLQRSRFLRERRKNDTQNNNEIANCS